MTDRRRWLGLIAILGVSALVRLHHLAAPMADSLQAKQVYVANKARSIARAPFDPLRNTLDFLDERGDRMILTEEVPLYTGLLAVGYRLFGEREWVGHALSLVGTLAALVAFHDLVGRERGGRSALIATCLLSASPLLIFYGRAVLPDPWMLAGMLGCAACYRRDWDASGRRWLVAAAACGSLAGLFKYFGLMVLIPLAEMAWRRAGSWRGVVSGRFVAIGAAIVLPVAAWMAVVFVRSPNPVSSGWVEGKVYPYLIFQEPGVLASRVFWAALLGRFPLRDFGVLSACLMVVGVATGRFRGLRGFLGGWTAMGLLFFFLLAPKLRDHDYYGMMLLPAAALWATSGLEWLVDRSTTDPRRRARLTTIALMLIFLVQSPWVMPGLFRQDAGKLALAEALRAHGSPGSRVVAMGPGIEFPTVVHYSRREGWPIHRPTLPPDWRDRIEHYRSLGASCVGVYFEPRATAEQRESYRPLIEGLPVLAHRSGLATRSGVGGEFFILGLGLAEAQD